MKFVTIWVVVGACGGVGVSGKDDLDRVIDLVYNPSAGPFQDTSQAFYNPRQSKGNSRENGRKSLAANVNFIFPKRVKIGGKLSKYGEKQHPKKAKLLRDGKKIDVEGGLDFGQAVFDESMGKRCILKKEEIETVKKAPILVCTYRPSSQCHYTYTTAYQPSQEEVCKESFLKKCQIRYQKTAHNETLRACHSPVSKVCNGEGSEECMTVYESSCSTEYKEIQPGKFVGDTACEKIPVEVCGAGCTYKEGAEECHDKVVTSVIDIPEEVCDLNPQKICNFITKLVPKLEPVQECSSVPKESCQLKYSKPEVAKTPLITKWCLDEDDLEIDETERSNADPILDTRRALPKSGLRNIEDESLTQKRVKRTKIKENERKLRYGEKIGRMLTKQTEKSGKQARFQTIF